MTLTKQKPRRPTATHKKRTGQHHKQGDHYIKAYWPYLPVFAVLLLGVALNSVIGRSHHSVLGYATNISSQVLLTETNDQRVANSETPLKTNDLLVKAAQAKANDMAARNYWSHVTPDGKQPWSFVDNTGYQYQAAGENLAYGFGTSDQVMTAWMNSAEHKANILNATYQEVGFATANIANYQGTGPETIVVAMYAEPTAAIGLTAVVNNPPVTVQVSNQAQTVSRLQLSASQTWVSLGLAALCGAAIMLFFVRHAFAWHKVLVRGEKFAMKHPLYDTLLVGVVVLVFIASHAAGSIL